MADNYWALAPVLVGNFITIIIVLFSNRTNKVDNRIKALEDNVDDIKETLPRMEENLRLFREECKERHTKRGKR
jgi:hypothetical protein